MKSLDSNSSHATVAVTRFNEPDDLVIRCLSSLLNQKRVQLDILFLDQKPNTHVKNFCLRSSTRAHSLVYKQILPKSLSYARNFALAASRFNHVLFLDCDATADPDWSHRLLMTFRKNDIAVVGGKIVPNWPGRPPIFIRSSIINEQYSILDLGMSSFPVDRVLGCNFGVNKKLLNGLKFSLDFGRINGLLLGGEETELCRRVINKGYQVYYNGHAQVTHHIRQNRLTLSWLIKRMYYAGMSRAKRKGRPRPISSQRNIYDIFFSPIFIPPYLIGYFRVRWF